MRFEGVICRCGSDDLASIDPGEEPTREGPTNVLLDAGRPSTGLCLSCLTARFPALNRAEAASA